MTAHVMDGDSIGAAARQFKVLYIVREGLQHGLRFSSNHGLLGCVTRVLPDCSHRFPARNNHQLNAVGFITTKNLRFDESIDVTDNGKDGLFEVVEVSGAIGL